MACPWSALDFAGEATTQWDVHRISELANAEKLFGTTTIPESIAITG
jgi:hypothetical protein